MLALRSLPKPVLISLATLFATATVLYSVLWILYGMRAVTVELGFDNQYLSAEHCHLIQSVVPGSPAERGGLKRGDCISRVDGAPLEGEDSITEVWGRHQPGDVVELTVQRPGVSVPVVLHATFRANSSVSAETGVVAHLGQDINRLFPIAFLTVGLAVLFLRLDDPYAWLLALMFGGFISIPAFSPTLPSPVRQFMTAYRTIFDGMVTGFFYFFFATFPTRSPLDRRLAWLKWLGLAVVAFLAIPVTAGRGGGAALGRLHIAQIPRPLVLTLEYGLIILGFVSLVWNAVTVTSSEARRKIRVILWGTLVGVVPATLALGASDFFGFHITLLFGATLEVLLWLFPLSFAYAVVKHRVLEIPVLLQRSARYLLVQRGFVLLLVVMSIGVTVVFALFFARYLQPLTAVAAPGGIALGTILGTVLLWTGTYVHKDVGQRIDRAFFRSAYDARMILEDLLDKTRSATDLKTLAELLEHHLREALQPSWLAVYLEGNDGRLYAAAGDFALHCQVIPVDEPAFVELARHGKPWEIWEKGPESLPRGLFSAELPPDCLVPLLGRDGRLLGVIVLGMRRSEEPYSAEDRRLLASVASQAGVALESIRLGEKVAERIEAERRAAQEMEFARQVQARLLPQKLPAMKTLDYVGDCLPARTVGGDYYDFLELRPGRLGMVLADIAGKGVPGALLMANLQANLRSQYAMAVDDLPRLLASVNRLFYQNTDEASYATLFFADYDDETRLLRYANCGHLPPLLLRASGDLQRQGLEISQVELLRSTSTVLGLFEEWQSEIAEVRLCPGDTLILLHRRNHRSHEQRGGGIWGSSSGWGAEKPFSPSGRRASKGACECGPAIQRRGTAG